MYFSLINSYSRAHHPERDTCWDTLFKVNNRLLTGGKTAAVLSKRLEGGGDGGNSGNYALFSVDPNTVIDRKLEVNIGAGGNPSTSLDNCCGCVGPELQYHTMLKKEPLVTILMVMVVVDWIQVRLIVWF